MSKIKQEHIDTVLRYLRSLSEFVKLEEKSGNQLKHTFNNGLVVNVYTSTGSVSYQGNDVNGKLVQDIKKFIEPFLDK